MKRDSDTGISFFQRYLTVWVIICMVLGILIGKYLPSVPAFLNQFEYAKVSIPMAILIWLMIYPMMMKVDFQSIKNVGKNPKGLFVTWITNWLIKPFTMYGIASLFFFVIFKAFITPELATEYLAGAVLLGAAPCTAMVFVWSTLTKGDPAYTVVQVATNDLIILFAFVPIVKFLLGVSNVSVPWDTLILSVVLFVVIPLAGGMLTRTLVIRKRGKDYFEVRRHHHHRSASDTGDDFLVPGEYHSGKSATHCSDCRAADFADFPDFRHCLYRILCFEVAAQNRRSCWHDRCIQFL